MLFRQEDLAVSYDPISEAANILNEGVYLTEDESFLSPKAIPVVKNARIGAGVIQFNDLKKLSEENDIDYIDAMYAVAEANEIDPNQLAVAVDEWKIIDTPEVVDELANVVIKPMSPYDPVAMFVESCVDCFLESGDYDYLDLILNEAQPGKIKRSTRWWYKTKDALSAAQKQYNEVMRTPDKYTKNQLNYYKTKLDNARNAHDAATMRRDRIRAKYGNKPEVSSPEPATSVATPEPETPSTPVSISTTPDTPETTASPANSEKTQEEVKETKTFLQKVKNIASKPREWLAKAITWLKNKYQSFQRVQTANSTDSKQRSILQKILAAISRALDSLEKAISKKSE